MCTVPEYKSNNEVLVSRLRGVKACTGDGEESQVGARDGSRRLKGGGGGEGGCSLSRGQETQT